MAVNTIPVISLKPFFTNDLEGIGNLVSTIRYACEKIGFFIVIDHGIDEALIEEHRRECVAYWNRPPQSIVIGAITQSPFVWLDFCPNLQYPLDEKNIPNHRGGFLLGPTQGRKGTKWQLDRHNVEVLWIRYYNEMERLMKIIMSLFALALGLSQDFFEDKLTEHCHPLRSVYYPKVDSPNENYERAGEHTDWGCLTILKQDENVLGLEIKNLDNTWTPVPIVPGGFVVNLGDLLPRWTNGKWRATPHRVVVPQDTVNGVCPARMSIPFFGLVNDNTMIECISSCIEPGESALYPPILAKSFFSEHEKFSVYK
jgi:isopenicillin N synthase-like dioxygenase